MGSATALEAVVGEAAARVAIGATLVEAGAVASEEAGCDVAGTAAGWDVAGEEVLAGARVADVEQLTTTRLRPITRPMHIFRNMFPP